MNPVFTALEMSIIGFSVILLIYTIKYVRSFGSKPDPFTVWTFAMIVLSCLIRSLVFIVNYINQLVFAYDFKKSTDSDLGNFREWYLNKT